MTMPTTSHHDRPLPLNSGHLPPLTLHDLEPLGTTWNHLKPLETTWHCWNRLILSHPTVQSGVELVVVWAISTSYTGIDGRRRPPPMNII